MNNFFKRFEKPKPTPEVPLNTPEKLEIRVSLATPDDWEICKNLRIEMLTGEDAYKFGATRAKIIKEQDKTETMWTEELSKPNFKIFLVRVGSSVIGMGLTEENGNKDGVWTVGWAYVKDGFRRRGIGKKLMAERLNLILQQEGVHKIEATVQIENKESIGNCESFGFKKGEVLSDRSKEEGTVFEYYPIELDLTNPEVKAKLIKRINEVLNAR